MNTEPKENEMDNETTSVGTDFPRQQKRVRDLRTAYVEIGPAGTFGLMVIDAALAEAEEAQASGDIVRILRAYEELRGIE